MDLDQGCRVHTIYNNKKIIQDVILVRYERFNCLFYALEKYQATAIAGHIPHIEWMVQLEKAQ